MINISVIYVPSVIFTNVIKDVMKKFYCDEDCTPYDVYQDHEPSEFKDGAYRVHYDCLTKEEKLIMDGI